MRAEAEIREEIKRLEKELSNDGQAPSRMVLIIRKWALKWVLKEEK